MVRVFGSIAATTPLVSPVTYSVGPTSNIAGWVIDVVYRTDEAACVAEDLHDVRAGTRHEDLSESRIDDDPTESDGSERDLHWVARRGNGNLAGIRRASRDGRDSSADTAMTVKVRLATRSQRTEM